MVRIAADTFPFHLPAQWCVGLACILFAVGPAALAAQAPDERISPLRWDDLSAGRPPQGRLFGREFPAGMLGRPGDLTPDNWFHDGHLRTYALLNLADVVRTVEIERGRGPVYMFGNARAPELLEHVRIRFTERDFPQSDEDIPLRQLLSWINCQGLLVVRHGKIVFEEYPGMDPSQRHHWMSVSKSSLNVLLGKLVREKKIDLTKRVADYLPELADQGYGGFLLQELADMNADVSMDERNYHDPASEFWDFGRSMGWFSEDGRWPGGNKQFLTTIKRLERPVGEGAEQVRYTSSNSQVLAWIVERVTGEPFVRYFEHLVWQRLGAVANANVTVDKQGFPFVGGGFSSTLRDLARYGEIWANRGVAPDGTRLFDESWMTENTSGKGLKLRDYRYHNQSYSKGTAITHQGHSGQMLWVHPATGVIVATFGSTTTPGGGNAWSRQAYLALAERIDQHLQKADKAATR